MCFLLQPHKVNSKIRRHHFYTVPYFGMSVIDFFVFPTPSSAYECDYGKVISQHLDIHTMSRAYWGYSYGTLNLIPKVIIRKKSQVLWKSTKLVEYKLHKDKDFADLCTAVFQGLKTGPGTYRLSINICWKSKLLSFFFVKCFSTFTDRIL